MIAIADCNSFYCSCERLFRPDLIGKPVVVLSNNDGCIVSRTDEAKALGIDMAVPYFQCKEEILKHGVTVFSSNYHLYGDMSQRVMSAFRQIMGDKNVEVYSVDEAFINFDVVPESQYRQTALQLKQTAEKWTGIPICVGVGPNKLLSKVANKLAKKNKQQTAGVYVLSNEAEVEAALNSFPVGDIWGIGRRYAEKLRQFGIVNAWQLRNMPLDFCRHQLGGVVGERLVRQLRGEEMGEMLPPREVKKMILTSRMFGRAVTELKEIEEAIVTYASRAAEKLRRQCSVAGELQVFVVYENKEEGYYSTRSIGNYRLLPVATSDTIVLAKLAVMLIREVFKPGLKYKKGGVILGRIQSEDAIQQNLFAPPVKLNKKLMLAIDNINVAYGSDMISVASAGNAKTWKMRQEMRSPRYTTHWHEIMAIK